MTKAEVGLGPSHPVPADEEDTIVGPLKLITLRNGKLYPFNGSNYYFLDANPQLPAMLINEKLARTSYEAKCLHRAIGANRAWDAKILGEPRSDTLHSHKGLKITIIPPNDNNEFFTVNPQE